MNERIRELLKQAEERYPRHLVVAVPEVVLRQDALEKFAELIVRECADKAHEFIIEDGDEFPKTSVAYRIKQHFGVDQ